VREVPALFVLAAENGEDFHFPTLGEMVNWPAFLLEGTPFAINKIVLIYFLAGILAIALFVLGGRGSRMVPKGLQNIMESSVDFVRNGIIMQTIGPDGMKFLPLLTSLFFFIFFCNVTKVIPPIFMPATGRIALPMFLTLVVFLVFLFVGFASQGVGGYFKSVLFPPGVPIPVYVLITPIELISVFVIRPFSLMVRLFANMLAGHILVVTFAVLTGALVAFQWYVVFAPLPFVMLILVIAFETLVSFLQAYIFTTLAAVYIGGAMHPEH
jgi:F-type H+-transporting ATPase subunit a